MSVRAQAEEPAERIRRTGPDPESKALFLEELDRILACRFFKNSHRSQQFLEFIVRRSLDGRFEDLKERSIGTELFQRPPDYHTGDDPVVRVQAGEVRRRLEQYYQAANNQSAVRIELTAGSYAPHFHLRSSDQVGKADAAKQPQAGPLVNASKLGVFGLSIAAICVVAILIAGAIWINAHNKSGPDSAINQFWAPALASQQPVLVCLAKPVVYRPSLELYRRYSSAHPNSFETEVERSNRVLPFDPQTKLDWSEMVPYGDYGVAVGDVEAAVSVSGLLGRLTKPLQVRIGDRYSFEDLRNSPSVLIGAFNNKWTMQFAQGLHFEFVENNGALSIHENSTGGREWHVKNGKSNRVEVDYAIVARMLDSNTGQFTIVAGGITGGGTQAAGEFISKPELMAKAVHALGSGWQNKNVEFVLQTIITDEVSGPPSVVAYYVW